MKHEKHLYDRICTANEQSKIAVEYYFDEDGNKKYRGYFDAPISAQDDMILKDDELKEFNPQKMPFRDPDKQIGVFYGMAGAEKFRVLIQEQQEREAC
jgi:hypothetical protein